MCKAHRLLYHSTLGLRGIRKKARTTPRWYTLTPALPEREFFIDNLLVRIHFIIVMIRWTGLAPWEFEFPFFQVPFLALPEATRGTQRATAGNLHGKCWVQRYEKQRERCGTSTAAARSTPRLYTPTPALVPRRARI